MGGRRTARWTVGGLVLVVAAAVALVLSSSGGSGPVALPDPALQSVPAGSAAGSTVAAAAGEGSASRPVSGRPGQVLVRYTCAGAGTITIGVLGASTSGQCFTGQAVEYAAALTPQAAGSLQVGAPRGVHWRVLVSALT